MSSQTRYLPEVREWAVWVVLEHKHEHEWQSAPIQSVAGS